MSKLSFRQRFMLLLAASVLLVWLVYALALKETFEIRQEYCSLMENQQQLSNAGSRLRFYQKELATMDSLIGADAYTGNFTQELLLKRITDFELHRQVVIVNFNKPHHFMQDGYDVFTYETKIRGAYLDLLKLLYELESHPFPGIFKSACFALEKEPGKKQSVLTLNLYVQEIKRSVKTVENKEI